MLSYLPFVVFRVCSYVHPLSVLCLIRVGNLCFFSSWSVHLEDYQYDWFFFSPKNQLLVLLMSSNFLHLLVSALIFIMSLCLLILGLICSPLFSWLEWKLMSFETFFFYMGISCCKFSLSAPLAASHIFWDVIFSFSLSWNFLFDFSFDI